LEVDVLLLTRGGGSLEDLWCFNSEHLAHEIYNSALPVVSAVGHEVDTTISDYVADVRAPTPSAGAELLSQDKGNKTQKLSLMLSRLAQGMRHYQLSQDKRFTALNHRLEQQDPKRRLQQLEQQFDEYQLKLEHTLQNKLSRLTLAHERLNARLQRQSPEHKLQLAAKELTHISGRFDEAIKDTLYGAEQRLKQAVHQLEAMSPLATLSRGYSISSDAKGKVIEDASKLKVGDCLHTRLNKGQLVSTVIEIVD
jgi:exodeoxyribonuclease VII large subunit